MSDEAIYVFATLKPKAGKSKELRQALDELMPQVREEPGNQAYDLFVSGDDEPVFHLFERYENRDAVRAHREYDHFKTFGGKVGELLDGAPDIVRMRAEDAPAQR